ncbi:MAG TPA: hypothetical protein VFN23_16150 [Ktedonobacteraceae bacterium]|nr:hypothetical protein [Ktedonobacteraceae bacterium]
MDNGDNDREESSPSEINERIWNEVLEVAARAAKKTGFLTGESTPGDEEKISEPQWQEFYSSLSTKEPLPETAIYRPERLSHTVPIERPSDRTRSIPGLVFSTLLYLWGISCCVMGLAGLMLGTFVSAQRRSSLGGLIEIAFCVLGLVVLVVLLLLRKCPRLRWSSRLISVTVTSVFGLIALIAGVAITEATHMYGLVSSQEDLVLGGIVFIYGLIVAALSFW